jgi:CheY-like chemotaxis protein
VESGHLVLTVRDTGIGIPANRLDGIFQAFTQADGSITRRFGGTGLGLTITSRFVTLMNGRLDVESQVGRGTVFRAHLPLTASAPRAPRPEFRGHRVLLSIAHPTQAEALREACASYRCDASIVTDEDGASRQLARAEAERRPFAVLVVGEGTDPQKILVNAGVSPPRRLGLVVQGTRSSRAGVDAVLGTPLDPGELATLLEDWFSSGPRRPADLTREQTLPAPEGLKVLLVEDNVVNQRVAMAMLERRRHRVTVAGDGREALETLAKERFDVVLMDMQMPVMSGLEATRLLRRREAKTGGHVPVVALTANAMSTDRDACLAAGMDDYLSKPIRIESLDAALRRAVPEWQP